MGSFSNGERPRVVLYASGAYGRTANLADWNAGKDFRVVLCTEESRAKWPGGTYFSKRDETAIREAGFTEIRFFAARRLTEGPDGPVVGSILGFRVDL